MLSLDHSVISDINGKQGSGYYRNDRCGAHWQENPRKHHTASEAELLQRQFFSITSSLWSPESFGGTKKDRESWTTFGNQIRVPNKKGELIKLSGYLAFKAVNIPRLIENQPIVWSAPIESTPPPPPRLIEPTAGYDNFGFNQCEVWLRFPQDMKTTGDKTPPLQDFSLHLSLFNDRDICLKKWAPYSIEWTATDILVLRFHTSINDYKHHFLKYTRGNMHFELEENVRAYGSFYGVFW